LLITREARESPPLRGPALTPEASRVLVANRGLLRNQREDGAHIRDPEIGGRSIEQATAEYHSAAIRGTRKVRQQPALRAVLV